MAEDTGTVQPNVKRLAELGGLPSSDDDAVDLKEVQSVLLSIVRPVSDDDARVLVTLFGPDDCFGLAQTLANFIETAPGWPLVDVLPEGKNEWIDSLRQHAVNAGLLPGKPFTRADGRAADGLSP